MKKYHFLSIISLVCVLFVFTQCTPEAEFDESLLIGSWKVTVSGSGDSRVGEMWKYNSNNRGVTWNPSQDVFEEEGDTFTWSLTKSILNHQITLNISESVIPKVVTITTLTSTKLEWLDDGKKTTLSKN